MRFRHYLFGTSVLLNLVTALYFLHLDGHLTNIYRTVNPIMGAILTQLSQ